MVCLTNKISFISPSAPECPYITGLYPIRTIPIFMKSKSNPSCGHSIFGVSSFFASKFIIFHNLFHDFEIYMEKMTFESMVKK